MGIVKKDEDILWGKAYILLSAANFFSWLSYNMVSPVLTGYLNTLGASVWICGIVGGLFAFMSCFSRPVSGLLSDRFNRKKLMSSCTVLMAVSLMVYSLVPSIPVILFFRGVHGVAFGISSTASLVLVSDCVSEKRMGEAVSYYGVMSVASMAIGPGLGIWISEVLGYQYCLAISAIILVMASVLTMIFPYQYNNFPRKDKRKLTLRAFVEPMLIGLSGVNAAFTMMNGVVSTFLVVYAVQNGIKGVSWHFTLNAFVLILTRIAMARVMNSWTLRQNLYPAFACGILTLLLISRGETLKILLIAAVVKAFAQGMSQPVLQTESLRIVTPEKRGVACSTMYIGGDLGQAVGPMLGGIIAEKVGYGNMYLFCIVPLMMALVYFIIRERYNFIGGKVKNGLHE